ncbi:unnamed protein product [Orchesella dallaii]|uniref:Uncharacterized protein n=1 Tax=Orchesella dallaii TaxID=48710 RepID=A0ABP1RAV3_9HEXA
MRAPVFICLCVVGLVTVFAVPIPDESSKINTTETSSTTEATPSETPSSSSTTEAEYSPPQLKVIDDEKPHDETAAASDIIGDEHNHEKRHHPTPSPEELEERRQAFIKALGGGGDEEGGGGGGGALTAGLGSLATDALTLITANANETFAPLREATAKAKQNFPNIGTTVNNFVRNGRAYAGRAYRGLAKNLRVKFTNALRFMLAGVTRLATTVGGLYNVVVSLLDVATRGLTAGAGVGARVLSVGANRTASALAAGTSLLKRITGSGLLQKPFNQAINTGDMFFKGVTEDIYDKFEWTNEGILSKVNLAQAIAPNFLLHAHENMNLNSGGGGEPEGGYSVHGGEDDPTLLSLATNAAELMLRGGREVEGTSSSSTTTEKESSSTTESSSTEASTKESSSTDKMSARSDNETVGVPPQDLLNDIFGLQMEINDLKNTTTNNTKT